MHSENKNLSLACIGLALYFVIALWGFWKIGEVSIDKFHNKTYNIEMDNIQDIITIHPNKRGGKPCIRGLRITVYDILDYLASGMKEEEILSDFPELTSEDIKACIIFAANRERRLAKLSA